MKTTVLFILLAGFLWIPSAAQDDMENPPMESFNMEASDAKAISIADNVMRSLGGRDNWDQTRYLAWSFFNGDNHVWDKWTGRSRWQKDSIVVLMNINTMEGQAWIDGIEVADDALQELLISAHRNWVNSSYWLLMPFKLKDTGTTLRYEGEGEMEDGRAAEILSLTFENVGYTPNNRYEVYVNKETMMVGQWAYYGSASDTEPAFVTPWQNWKQYGTVMLSDNRGLRTDGSPWVLTDVGVYSELANTVFDNPIWLDMSTLQ